MEVICGGPVTKVAWLNHATVAPPVAGVPVHCSGDPRGDQGLHVVGPQAIGPVGEIPLFEVCTCWMVDDLQPAPADQPLDLDDRPAGLQRLAN
jgi:hypothetical protein